MLVLQQLFTFFKVYCSIEDFLNFIVSLVGSFWPTKILSFFWNIIKRSGAVWKLEVEDLGFWKHVSLSLSLSHTHTHTHTHSFLFLYLSLSLFLYSLYASKELNKIKTIPSVVRSTILKNIERWDERTLTSQIRGRFRKRLKMGASNFCSKIDQLSSKIWISS
jgi:hypothetical protein